MEKYQTLEKLKLDRNDYDNNFYNISDKFFIPKRLEKFFNFQNVKEDDKEAKELIIDNCFKNIAGSILNQINILVGQKIIHYLNLSKNKEEFINFVGQNRYENLRLAIYEEIKFRLISNSFPETQNVINILPNSLNKNGISRDFSGLENYLCPVSAALIINSGWNRLELPNLDKLLTYYDLINNIINNLKEKDIQILEKIKVLNETDLIYKSKLQNNENNIKQNILKLETLKNTVESISLSLKANTTADAETLAKFNALQKELNELISNELNSLNLKINNFNESNKKQYEEVNKLVNENIKSIEKINHFNNEKFNNDWNKTFNNEDLYFLNSGLFYKGNAGVENDSIYIGRDVNDDNTVFCVGSSNINNINDFINDKDTYDLLKKVNENERKFNSLSNEINLIKTSINTVKASKEEFDKLKVKDELIIKFISLLISNNLKNLDLDFIKSNYIEDISSKDQPSKYKPGDIIEFNNKKIFLISSQQKTRVDTDSSGNEIGDKTYYYEWKYYELN